MTRAEVQGLEAPDPKLEADIRSRLDEVEEALEKAVHADSDLLADAASYLLAAGGKRFRPMLVLLAGHFGDPGDPRLVPGAVAIELTHLATLYHDDVIDESDARRGIPSVNARWDNTVAILAGDYLFARASEIASDLGGDVTRLLARTIATVCDGQIREVDASGRVDQTAEHYTETIRRKTASLIATSCRLGAMLSDAAPEHIETLERFGDALGMAFQVSDDVMDVISSPEQLGKEPGSDIREGVFTLPVLEALRLSARRDELRRVLQAGAPANEDLELALAIVREDGSLDAARRVVAAEVRLAKDLASRLPEGTARDALHHLASFIAVRCGADA